MPTLHINSDIIEDIIGQLRHLNEDLIGAHIELRSALTVLSRINARTTDRLSDELRMKWRRCDSLADETESLYQALQKILARFDETERLLVRKMDDYTLSPPYSKSCLARSLTRAGQQSRTAQNFSGSFRVVSTRQLRLPPRPLLQLSQLQRGTTLTNATFQRIISRAVLRDEYYIAPRVQTVYWLDKLVTLSNQSRMKW